MRINRCFATLLIGICIVLCGCTRTNEITQSERESSGTEIVESSDVPEEESSSIDSQEADELSFSYIVKDDGTAEIYSYRADPVPEIIEIPSEIDGLTVTSIAEIFKTEDDVKKVVIPDTVKEIQGETFMFAESIEEIEIQGVIEYLGSDAMLGCDSLKSISFPEGLTYVGEGAILCKNMTEIHLPASLDADFDSTIAFRYMAPDVVVYTPAGSPTDVYARSIGVTVVNE